MAVMLVPTVAASLALNAVAMVCTEEANDPYPAGLLVAAASAKVVMSSSVVETSDADIVPLVLPWPILAQSTHALRTLVSGSGETAAAVTLGLDVDGAVDDLDEKVTSTIPPTRAATQTTAATFAAERGITSG
jgi:hypothetical protein